MMEFEDRGDLVLRRPEEPVPSLEKPLVVLRLGNASINEEFLDFVDHYGLLYQLEDLRNDMQIVECGSPEFAMLTVDEARQNRDVHGVALLFNPAIAQESAGEFYKRIGELFGRRGWSGVSALHAGFCLYFKPRDSDGAPISEN